jgi:hypothetical protein
MSSSNGAGCPRCNLHPTFTRIKNTCLPRRVVSAPPPFSVRPLPTFLALLTRGPRAGGSAQRNLPVDVLIE